MSTVQEFMKNIDLSRNNQVLLFSLIAAVPLIIFSIYYASSDEKEVLFSGMSEDDISNVSMVLDEKGVDYHVDLDSSTINVNKDDVHEIRMSVMSDGVVLDSNVGFEIFNDAEFGMTEFSQKINYQRALQGELARTISSLKEIKYARVHIVQPKNRLFKAPSEKSSASITLFVKRGAKLTDLQIRGIQNIASSSIEGLVSDSVVITNQSGIVLSQQIANKLKNDSSKFSKREKLEGFYKKKVISILNDALESKSFVVSVNVEFDYTKSKIQEEQFLNNPNDKIITKERVSTSKKSGSRTKDVEYKVGKRIEKTEPESGRVKRISIGVLVPKNVSEIQANRLKEVISMAIGISSERGDSIALFADDFSINTIVPKSPNIALDTIAIPNKNAVKPTSKVKSESLIVDYILGVFKVDHIMLMNIMLAMIFVLLVLTIIIFISRHKSHASLTIDEKQQIVDDLSVWFSKGK